MPRFSSKLITAAASLGLGLSLSCSVQAADQINYEDHIQPIFRAKCLSCHNTNKKTADLDLSNYTALMQGGGSGAAIEPGDPDASYLYNLMTHESEPYMPPNSDRVPDAMLETVKKWIETGAPETSSSKVKLPKKASVSMSVDVAAGARPEGPPALPDVLGLEPVVHTDATTAVSAIATSPWAKLVAVAGQKQVVLYSSATMQPLGVLPFPEGQAKVLKFSRTGGLLLAGGGHGASKGLAVVWDVKTGERIMQVGDELDEVLAADISADQSLVALGGPGKVVRVYNTATGELAYEILKHTDWIYSLEFSPDSILLATADRAGGLHVWESFTGREYLTLNGHKDSVNAVSWRIDSNVLASASKDASIKLWEMENGGNIKSWTAHGGGATSMEFCRDGRVVSCGRDKVTKIWDQNGKQQKAFEAFGDLALQVSHCDETDRVIAGDWTGEVRVWGIDGTRVGNLTTNPPMLDTRLADASASIAPLTQTAAVAKQKQDAATAAKTAHLTKTAAAKAAFAAAQKTLTDRQAALKALQTQLPIAQKAQTDTQAKLAALQKAVPELTSAADSAQAASTMMSDDPELKKVVDKLKQQVAERTTQLQQADVAFKAAAAAAATVTKNIATTTAQIPVDQKAIANHKTNVEKFAAGLAPIDKTLLATQNAFKTAQAAANKATADVQRWQQYIALRDELKALEQTQAEKDVVHLASLEADAMLNQKQQQVATAQQTVQAKTQAIAAAEKKMADMNAVIVATAKQQGDLKTNAGQHEQAIPVLQAAVEKLKSVSTMLPEDAEVKASATALEKTTAEKVAALASLKQQMTDAAKKMADSKAVVTATLAAAEVAKKEMAEGQKVAERLTAEAVPIAAQVAAAKAKLQAAEAQLAKVQAVVEARRQKLRPQLQVIQAAR